MKKIKIHIIIIACFIVVSANLFAGAFSLDDISDGIWLKLGIAKEGIYTITASELSSRGINISKDKINTIKVYGQSGQPMPEALLDSEGLNEQAIIVNTNTDGSLNSIVFYASGASGFEYDSSLKRQRHYLNYYSNTNSYLLTFGKTEGLRASALNEVNDGEVIDNKPISYRAGIFHEEDRYMPLSNGAGLGLLWLGETISGNDVLVDEMPNFTKTGDVNFLISVAHTAPDNNNIKIEQGANTLVEANLDGISGAYESARIFTYDAKISATKMPDARSILKFTYSGSPLYPFHNFREIVYNSYLIPISNEITLFSYDVGQGTTEYSINGFTSANGNTEIYGFDVSDMSNPKILKNCASTGGFFIFRTNEKNGIVRKYYVSSQMQSPTIDIISMKNLHNVNSPNADADVLVITCAEFMNSANKYAEYRSKQSGYKVAVVDLQDIYNEFSYGRLDLTAVRNYIKYASENWSNTPQYVFLWGTGNYDYRGIESSSAKMNFVPVHQRIDGSYRKVPVGICSINANSGNYATDDFFVCIKGKDAITDIPDRLPDLAIGRVPLVSDKQGLDYIDKLNTFENHSDKGSWRRNALFLADDGPTTSNNAGDTDAHTNDAEILASKMPDDFLLYKIMCAAYPVVYESGATRRIPRVTEEIFEQLNVVGATMFLYVGHGNTNTLTHERVFVRDNIQNFTNSNKLFFFGAASCEVGRFDHPNGCIGGDIVVQPKNGAIASFSATRVSVGSENRIIMSNIMKYIVNKDSLGNFRSVGEASMLAKINGSASNETYMYVLLGDPTLHLPFPDLSVDITEVNGEIVEGKERIEIEAMKEVTVKGNIVDKRTGNTETDFNGSVELMLNEPKETAKVVDEYNTTFSFIKNGATLVRSSFKVENGEFEATFIVPADISFSEKNSLLYCYASDTVNNLFAQGGFDKLWISGISTSISNDMNGPNIIVKLDNHYFVNGDMVSKEPLLLVDLWDETGLNTTGLGIGHRIEAFIDNETEPIDLTTYFISSLTDPKAGSITKQLYGLSAGYHTIRVRAWDIFNNYSDGTASFIIPTENEEQIFLASFVPNPVTYSELTGISVEYNIAPPINATIGIFDILGNEVTTFNTIITSHSRTIIPWHSLNKPLVAGTYYYRVTFNYAKTATSERSQKKYGALGVITK